MIAQLAQRKVVIFTGGYVSLSTIELIEAITHEFSHWQLTILQEHRPRRRGPYLRGKLRRLKREPISYPLELICQFLSKIGPRPRGRVTGPVAMPRSYDQLIGANVSYRQCTSFADPGLLQELTKHKPWLGIALSAPVLKTELFTIPRWGTINLHKSLLPDYKGMPPAFWELHDGADHTGVSVHWVDEGLDTGAIIHQKALEIPLFSTREGLSAELDLLSREVLLETLHQIESGQVSAKSQPPAQSKANRRPSWLMRRALDRVSWGKRNPNRSAASFLGQSAKKALLSGYVYLWAPLRNMFRRITGRCRTTVLLYHRVSDRYLDSVTVGVEQFKKQLAILKRHYHVMDLPTFLAGKGKPRTTPGVVITFDDGYRDNLLAGKLLRRAGLPCTFFLSTRIVGSDQPFEHDVKKLGRRIPSLSWDQVRQLARWGFHFGNHTAGHVNLAEVPLQQGLDEIDTAQRDLQAHLGDGSVLPALAYPFGRRNDITQELRQALPSLGIEYCLSAYGGVNPPDFQALNVLRQAVDHNFSNIAFRAALEGWRGRHPQDGVY